MISEQDLVTMENSAVFVALLLLSQAYVVSLSSNPTLPNTGGSGQNINETESPPLIINNYVFKFFKSVKDLKQSNCTGTFLGQSVSEHLCNSNSVAFKFPQDPRATPQENDYIISAYEMCFDLVVRNGGRRLGYDVIVYKRSTAMENTSTELEVFITERVCVEDFNWEQLLSYQKIESKAFGWQVFHLNTRFNENLENEPLCVNLLVRAKENTTYRFLNRSSIQDILVLGQREQDELDKQPLTAMYIFKTPPPRRTSPFIPSPGRFPFFTRSVPEKRANPRVHPMAAKPH